MIEQKGLIDEINEIKNMYLISLSEEDDYLKIKVCSSKYEDCDEQMASKFKIKGIENIIKGAKDVIKDTSTIYEIVFDSYIAYSSRWESYTTWDEYEVFILGKNYRVFSQSKFLDYVIDSTFASHVTVYHHYGIYCEWQIIDIVSAHKPTISKYTLAIKLES